MTMQPQPSLLEALDAFYLDHRLCAELEGGMEDSAVRAVPLSSQASSMRKRL
jgi:hypothetical protein